MFKYSKLAVISALVATGTGAFASPMNPSLLPRADGVDCGVPSPFAPDSGFAPSDGYEELTGQIWSCCSGTIGSKWLEIGDPLTCDVTVGSSNPTKVTLTTQATTGGFDLDQATCANALISVMTSCFIGNPARGNVRVLSGCSTSADGNFKACVWPRCTALTC